MPSGVHEELEIEHGSVAGKAGALPTARLVQAQSLQLRGPWAGHSTGLAMPVTCPDPGTFQERRAAGTETPQNLCPQPRSQSARFLWLGPDSGWQCSLTASTGWGMRGAPCQGPPELGGDRGSDPWAPASALGHRAPVSRPRTERRSREPGRARSAACIAHTGLSGKNDRIHNGRKDKWAPATPA